MVNKLTVRQIADILIYNKNYKIKLKKLNNNGQ
jgi:hypothetical protein